MVVVRAPPFASFPTTTSQLNIVFRATPYRVRLASATGLSSRIRAAQFAIPSLPSFHIPWDFPVEGPFRPISDFLNGEDLHFSMEDRLFAWAMAVYLEITSIIPELTDYILDCVEQPSFLRPLEWLFHMHCDVTLPVNLLRATVDISELLRNPGFQKLDDDLLDLFFTGAEPEANEFLKGKRGRLLRRIDFKAMSPSERAEMIRDPTVDLNWLKSALAAVVRDGTRVVGRESGGRG
jgi:hypothetical protein